MVLSLSLSEWVWHTSLSARLECIQNLFADVAKAPPFYCLPVWAKAFPALGRGRAEAGERGGNCQVSFSSAEGWFFLLHRSTPTACFFYPLSRERQDQDFWWRQDTEDYVTISKFSRVVPPSHRRHQSLRPPPLPAHFRPSSHWRYSEGLQTQHHLPLWESSSQCFH